ncbi:MAG TPA: hypothetical protein VMW52_09290, partial [Phycisphaerae bacterium]|nr:hypothetical protein [Phycisphaerae bacterium]
LALDAGAGGTNGALTIGATNAASVTIGKASRTTTVNGLTVLSEDNATTNATSDVLTISHSTSGTAAANIGTGISIKVEDSDGVTEQTTIESIVTDVGTAGATVDADVLVQSRVAGTMATVFRFDADEGGSGGAKLFQIGGDANAVSLELHPATTARGTVRFTAANSAGDTVTEIVNASQAAARTLTIPDGGQTTANFLLSQGAQTIAGVNTFTANPVVSGLLGYDSTFTVTGMSGSTSDGGAVTIAGGTGDANNAGGAASVTGGVGYGTGTGGAASLVGGASGSGATGTGGGITITGGAGLATAASGGAITIAGGVSKGAAAVTGGLVSILSGAAVGVGSTAGAVTVDSGAAGSGTAGAVSLGNTNAASIAIGHSSITTTITGDVAIAAGDNVTLAQGDGYIIINAATSGSLKFLPAATTTSAVTVVTPSCAGATTITLPNATATLSGIGLAETFSGIKTFSAAPLVTLDDETDGIQNALTLTHSSSNDAATVADGVAISFQLENATGTHTVEEWASIDAVSTTITDSAEDGDLVLRTMLGGTVTDALRINAAAQEVVIGADATNTSGMHALRIWPLTAAKGSILIQPADNTGDDTVTITNTNTGGDITVTLPAETCTLSGVGLTETITGTKTFSTMPIIPTTTVAADGNDQSNAAAITTGFTLVSAADASKGVKLPAAAAGLVCIVKNGAAAVLKVWPNTDDAINAVAANGNDVLAASTAATYVAYDETTWYTIPLLGS